LEFDEFQYDDELVADVSPSYPSRQCTELVDDSRPDLQSFLVSTLISDEVMQKNKSARTKLNRGLAQVDLKDHL